MTAVAAARSADRQQMVRRLRTALAAEEPSLTNAERAALARVTGRQFVKLFGDEPTALARLTGPIEVVTAGWHAKKVTAARSLLLAGMQQRQSPYWVWDEDAWTQVALSPRKVGDYARHTVVSLGHLLGGQRRLHYRARVQQLRKIAEMVFGRDAITPAVTEVETTLMSWLTSPKALPWQISNAVVDLLLSSGSPHLRDITETVLLELVAERRPHPTGQDGRSRRQGLHKVSRVLAAKGIISRPLTANQHNTGPKDRTLATVPDVWREVAQRWRRLATHESSTVRGMFTSILIAGRWAAERHPEAVDPARWTRDIAAEYVADTLTAVGGQWGGHNNNHTILGRPLTAAAMADRIYNVRSFFNDLIDWDWIPPRFDPRQVLIPPLSVRAQMQPNPRIIDDATWAKLMAAGLTINVEDVKPFRSKATANAGLSQTYYPIEMIRALVGVWLFAGCRMDEIRRLELDCIVWDEGTDEATGDTFPICLLRVPQNKTSGPFSKPVDPIVGQLIEAWKVVRPPQPDLPDRKTGRKQQFLFCHRGILLGVDYLNKTILPSICAKAGVPESDSRGALTSHRARATIATQLLNAREPLTLADLQQWLGHKHPASTRHYAAILQRTLTAAYRKADYFARNVRTIQVLIDRESILTGAAAGGGQPWKYYDLGDGYCSYDFFAKCPHRLACARCPFYLPKQSHAGQLLAVRAGVEQMLEQVDLTDEERAALEGDRDALTALTSRLADMPTPAGPTPKQLGTDVAFIPLSALRANLPDGPA